MSIKLCRREKFKLLDNLIHKPTGKQVDKNILVTRIAIFVFINN